MNQEQSRNYLKRMGYEKDIQLTAACLQELIWAHLTNIPFENLDIYDKKEVPSLEFEDLYRKIVTDHRGGYCFEMNTLFYHLLKSLGFCCYPIAVRIFRNPELLPARLHRATIVELEGRKYFCDVGFGGPGPKGLLEFTKGEQCIDGKKFRIIDGKFGLPQIEREQDGVYIPLFCFADEEAAEPDFGVMNFYCSRSEDALFTRKRILNLCLENGSLALTDDTLTERCNGKVTTTTFQSAEERMACIREKFWRVQ